MLPDPFPVFDLGQTVHDALSEVDYHGIVTVAIADNGQLKVQATVDGECHFERFLGIPKPDVQTCDCGIAIELNRPSEDVHYVWAVRADGTRSNLGCCPFKSGFDDAARRAAGYLGRGIWWSPILDLAFPEAASFNRTHIKES